MQKLKQIMTFLTGFVVGVLSGVGATLLYAPQSGKDTRKMLEKNSRLVQMRARESMNELQNEVNQGLDSVRIEARRRIGEIEDEANRRAKKLQEISNELVSEQKESLERNAKKARKVLSQ